MAGVVGAWLILVAAAYGVVVADDYGGVIADDDPPLSVSALPS
ncbi:MAG: hypothetical protein U5L11_03340 [Arhodomonas sp.]|nr:hypothetical protein [Arhodomonas sp.]